MNRTMLDILKERLFDGLAIVSVKETNTKYTITFEYDESRAKAELPKSCNPNFCNEVADRTICTAMSTIYFNRGEFDKAQEWLDKLLVS